MPLTNAKKGQKVVLKEITWSDQLSKKLNNLGLTPGVKFDIISHSQFGPWIIEVRGARLALGRGVIEKISVEVA